MKGYSMDRREPLSVISNEGYSDELRPIRPLDHSVAMSRVHLKNIREKNAVGP